MFALLIFLKWVLQQGDIVCYLLWRDFTVEIVVIAILIKSNYLEYVHLEKRHSSITEGFFCAPNNKAFFLLSIKNELTTYYGDNNPGAER